MSGQTIDEFLDLLLLTTEEQRTVKILLWFGTPSDFENISKEYTKRYNIKVGSKLYHILNNLVKKKFVAKAMKGGKKVFCIHYGNLNQRIKKVAGDEILKAQQRFQKIESIGNPSMTTYIGEDQVTNLILKISEMEKEGVEEHSIIDILSYPIKSNLSKKEFLKQRTKHNEELLKLRKRGKLVEYFIAEKSKIEQSFKERTKIHGKDYVQMVLKYIIKGLDTNNFNIVFTDNVAFKFFVIPDKIAVTAWFSSPTIKYLDRAIAFWYPDSIKALDEYFWAEWKRALGTKSEEENRVEVKTWVEELVKRL
ncbi:MAG: hypothetical protein KJ906_02440 [Nanoarchaeota archaeon]|nr:hypothetical protein [Nanoarchaeota archaeon]